jgi:hypothetical protein
MRTVAGTLQQDFFPQSLCFHPQLDLVATVQAGPRDQVRIFNSKSFIRKQAFAQTKGLIPVVHMTFAGQGTKLLVVARYATGKGEQWGLWSFPLNLNDDQRAMLKKSFSD